MAVLIPGWFVYLAHFQTGSRSTRESLLESIDGATVIGRHHAAIGELQKHLDGEIVVTTVRNPYEATVAQWRSGDQRWPFREWLPLWDKQRRGGPLFHHVGPGVRLLRFESLQDDVNELLREKDLGPVELPWIGFTKPPGPWADHYDSESYEIVDQSLGAEILALGYERTT